MKYIKRNKTKHIKIHKRFFMTEDEVFELIKEISRERFRKMSIKENELIVVLRDAYPYLKNIEGLAKKTMNFLEKN
jgi:hypothetical protein